MAAPLFDTSEYLCNFIFSALENDPKSIHRTNKGQIFNDIFSLAKIGQVPYKEAFESTKYFSVENDLIPWRSALYSLKFIKTMFWRTPGFGMFKKYMESQMIRSYRILGFFSQKSESIDTQSLREDIVSWMCDLGTYVQYRHGYPNPDSYSTVRIRIRVPMSVTET